MSSNPIRALQTQEQGGAIAPKNEREALRDLIASNEQNLVRALPEGVSVQRFMQIGLTAVLSNPDLVFKCSRASVLLSLVRCCQLGLEPGTPLGHAYLVPFGKEATVIVGYKGYQALAWRSDGILVDAEIVKLGDHFLYELGLDRKLEHKPLPDESKRGDVTHAYAVARLPDGRTIFEVMTRSDLDDVMLNTRGKGQSGPWKTSRPQMQKKTVIRRLCNTRLPLNPEKIGPAHAAAIDEAAPDVSALGIADGEVPVYTGPQLPPPEPADDPPSREDAAPAGDPPAEDAAKIDGAGAEAHHREAAPAAEQVEGLAPSDYPIQRGDEWVDINGEVWNPEIHATAKGGGPSMVKSGAFRMRRGGPAAGAAKPQAAAEPAQAEEAAPATQGAAGVDLEPETLDLIPPEAGFDWTDDDNQEEAFGVLKEAIRTTPAKAEAIINQNAKILQGFTDSRKMALQHLMSTAAKLAENEADQAAGNGGAGEPEQAGGDPWLFGA